jgi:hypothetical protein
MPLSDNLQALRLAIQKGRNVLLEGLHGIGKSSLILALARELGVAHAYFNPDAIFVLTDGFTPRPKPSHPERWMWILPPWGSTTAIPEQSRKEFFDVP